MDGEDQSIDKGGREGYLLPLFDEEWKGRVYKRVAWRTTIVCTLDDE